MDDLNKRIMDDADYQTFAAGDLILKCPTPHPRVGYITRGKVTVSYKDSDQLVSWSASVLTEGEWLGAETFDCTCPRTTSISWAANETCVIGFLTLDQISSLGLWPEVIRSIGGQKAHLLKIAARTQLDGKTRVQILLDECVKSEGLPAEGGILVRRLDRTAIAKQAGVGREYVSRLLTDMRMQGRLEPRGRGILFKTFGANQ